MSNPFLKGRFKSMSLKNKFFFSVLAVILVISGTIALLARWILVSGLTQELELRGTAVAQSVAGRGAAHILEQNTPELLTLIFDEKQLRERKHLVAYIYVTDAEGNVLSHTFTQPFPSTLLSANPLRENQQHSKKVVNYFHNAALDIAVPVKEGLYRIGTVHVGLSQDHINALVGKLRVMFLGFISAVVVITFLVSHRLARNITDPVVRLTKISDDLSRGDFNTALAHEGSDNWNIADCPAYTDTDLPCWHFDEQHRNSVSGSGLPPSQLHRCKECVFYKKRNGDEVTQLSDSFRNMVWSIRLYRRRLRESETTYRSLFASGPDPIFVVDCQTHRILDANPRAEELYGYTRDELVGLDFTILGPEQTRECLALFENEGHDPKRVYTQRIQHRHKNGSALFVNINASPISYRGHPALIVAAADVTDMVEKDAQLIQASKMKSLGEMSAGVAHELNQPLNAIRMGSDFLHMAAEQEMYIPKEQQMQVVSEISTQVDRAADIINTLRAFGRKADLFDEDVDLNAPVKAVVSLVGRQFLLQNVEIHLNLASHLPPVLTHDNRLQQVLFNLVSNARDAIVEMQHAQTEQGITPEKGSIIIRTYVQNEAVCVSVTDNGPGISQEQREKVFEPFYTTKATGQGMGLGLAITYGIVREYSGEITISSKEGQGTTFTICFPAHERARATT